MIMKYQFISYKMYVIFEINVDRHKKLSSVYSVLVIIVLFYV